MTAGFERLLRSLRVPGRALPWLLLALFCARPGGFESRDPRRDVGPAGICGGAGASRCGHRGRRRGIRVGWLPMARGGTPGPCGGAGHRRSRVRADAPGARGELAGRAIPLREPAVRALRALDSGLAGRCGHGDRTRAAARRGVPADGSGQPHRAGSRRDRRSHRLGGGGSRENVSDSRSRSVSLGGRTGPARRGRAVLPDRRAAPGRGDRSEELPGLGHPVVSRASAERARVHARCAGL